VSVAILLALDVGEKTIGVAFSDETETFAFPGETIQRQEGYRRDMGLLRRLIQERGVREIVVGMPLMMDGSRAIQAEKVEEFVEQLRRYTRLPIHLQDERLSTSEVDRMLIAAGRRREERKKVIDSGAASVILQGFMDRRKQGTA
jgi:putative Holliday junction resolvase